MPPTTIDAHHTPSDLQWLQACLDDSYRRAGDHLLAIHTRRARLSAPDLVRRLPTMHVMVVATVSSDGRPFTGPVDAFLHHGRIHFGTAASALRARHLAHTSVVSVTHVEGEQLTLSVHGRARPLDLAGRDSSFAERLRAHYGLDWDDWSQGSVYYAVEPDRMLAADMSVHTRDAG